MKQELKYEEYLNLSGSRRDKINMIELRGGMNILRINTDRRQGIRVEDRWCRCCGEVEVEKHFMLECYEYRVEREEMMLELNDICGVGGSVREGRG